MKKNNILLIFLIALIFGACEKDDEKPVLDNENAIAPSVLSPASGSSYVFKLADATSEFDKITWSAADYGAKVPVDYILELSTQENFVDGVELATTADLEYTPIIGNLNMLLYDLGITTATQTEVFLRVNSGSSHDSVKALTGNSTSVKISPFEYNKPNIVLPSAGNSYILDVDTIGVSWEEFNWSAVNYGEGFTPEYTLELDITGNNFSSPTLIYSGEETSFTPTIKDVNKALLDAGLEPDVAASVEFRVVSSVDGSGVVASDASAYAITPFSVAPSGPEPDNYWGIIGSATADGWDADQDMKWDAETDTWSITIDLVDGAIKFRADDSWEPNNLGDVTPADGVNLIGHGADIPVTAGNYTITMKADMTNESDPWDPDNPITGTYTIVKN